MNYHLQYEIINCLFIINSVISRQSRCLYVCSVNISLSSLVFVCDTVECPSSATGVPKRDTI